MSTPNQTLYVTPAEGLQVRDPRNAEPLPVVGAEVPRIRYWLRRLRDGDVIESKRPKVASKKDTSKE